MRGCRFIAASLDHSNECGTESNAFFRSTKQLYSFFLLNVWLSARVCSTNMASDTRLPFRKPNCSSGSSLDEVAHKLIRLHKMLVKSLPMQLISEMPR